MRLLVQASIMMLCLGINVDPSVSGSVCAADSDTTPTVDEALKRLSDEIAKFVNAEPDAHGKIAVSSFQGPSNSGAGARISQGLRSHLQGQCDVVEFGASFSVGGRFLGQKQSDGRFVTVIEAEICDALGGSVHSLRRKIITGLDEGLAFFAPSSVDLSQQQTVGNAVASTQGRDKGELAENNPAKASETLVGALVKPKIHLDAHKKTITRVSEDSPYGLEIVRKVADSYLPLDVIDENGLAKVNLGADDVYAIRLYNGSQHPVGCRLTIDGINIFALSENPSFASSNVIMALKANGAFLIKGWHHSDELSHEFRVTNYGDTAAARFGVFEGVGSLTATFFEAIPPSGTADQLATRGLGTGSGNLVQQTYDRLQVKFGNPVGAVSVRYLRPEHPSDLPPQ